MQINWALMDWADGLSAVLLMILIINIKQSLDLEIYLFITYLYIDLGCPRLYLRCLMIFYHLLYFEDFLDRDFLDFLSFFDSLDRDFLCSFSSETSSAALLLCSLPSGTSSSSSAFSSSIESSSSYALLRDQRVLREVQNPHVFLQWSLMNSLQSGWSLVRQRFLFSQQTGERYIFDCESGIWCSSVVCVGSLAHFTL